MRRPTYYHFVWDDEKAVLNERKHGVTFESAVAVFQDPLSVARYDRGHSELEERWYTVGQLDGVVLIAVFHTLNEYDDSDPRVRIISARRATLVERREYESDVYSVRETRPELENRIMTEEDDMPAEIDFSNGVRGKFYRENAVFHYPVYLKPELLVSFSARARAQGVSLTTLLNSVLQRELEESSLSPKGS